MVVWCYLKRQGHRAPNEKGRLTQQLALFVFFYTAPRLSLTLYNILAGLSGHALSLIQKQRKYRVGIMYIYHPRPPAGRKYVLVVIDTDVIANEDIFPTDSLHGNIGRDE